MWKKWKDEIALLFTYPFDFSDLRAEPHVLHFYIFDSPPHPHALVSNWRRIAGKKV